MTTTSASTSKLICLQHVNGKFKINVSEASTPFIFPREGKIIKNDLRGNKNYFELPGGSKYRGFESPRGKITVNVRGKSRGNRFPGSS